MRATHPRTIDTAAREQRSLVWVLAALAVVLFTSAPAQATLHFMVIQEVFVGPPSDGIARPVPLTPDQRAQYVMLRMTSSGNQFVDNSFIRVENANGVVLGNFGEFTANSANGGGACSYPNCPAIIMGTQAADNLFTFNFDQIVEGQAARVALPQSGGRVCFMSSGQVYDCVAWGNFNCQVSGTCNGPNTLQAGEFSGNGCDTNFGTNAPALVYGRALAHGAAFNSAAKASATDYSNLFPRHVNNAGANNNIDSDNDGLINQLDCNDASTALLWDVTEVQNDTVSFANRSLVQWASQAAVSGNGVVYDVAKGTAANRVNYSDASCLALHTMNSSVLDPAVLPPGGAFYYVVKAEGCTASTWGAGITATSRNTALNPICP